MKNTNDILKAILDKTKMKILKWKISDLETFNKNVFFKNYMKKQNTFLEINFVSEFKDGYIFFIWNGNDSEFNVLIQPNIEADLIEVCKDNTEILNNIYREILNQIDKNKPEEANLFIEQLIS